MQKTRAIVLAIASDKLRCVTSPWNVANAMLIPTMVPNMAASCCECNPINVQPWITQISWTVLLRYAQNTQRSRRDEA